MSEALPVLRNVVAGEYADTLDGLTSDVVDPSTGEAYAKAPVSTAADIDAAMSAARDGFETWRAATPSERQRALLRMAVYGFEEYTRIKHVMSYLGRVGRT